jgi:hypothetical protein
VQKRIGILVLLFGLWVMPTHAQDSLWQVWLYDKTAGLMTRVNDGGVALESLPLPTVQTYTTFSDRVAVSPDGRYMAYTLTDPTTLNNAGILYDKESNAVQTLYPTGSENVAYSSLWQAANSHLFTEVGFATGYSVSGGGWRVLVHVFGGGTVSLESNNAMIVTLGLSSAAGITPVVQAFTGTNVTFTLFSMGTDSADPVQTYIWDYVSGTVQSFGSIPLSDVDVLPNTGEIVSASFDPGFPHHAQDFTLFSQLNTLHVYVPQTSMRFPFYTEQLLSLYQPRFVENGRRILVGAFDETTSTAEWRLLERSGLSVQPENILRAPNDFVMDAHSLLDGFVYVTTVLSSNGTTTLMAANTQTGLNSGDIVYIGEVGVPLRLVWVEDTRLRSAPAERFRAWGQLTSAESQVISPLQLPTIAPLAGTTLVVGGTALINTTEGDQLNLRSGPGREFSIVTQLPDGMRVTIIEGPREADGLRWWHIQAGDVEGWVVESVNDDGAIIQTLIPG